MAAPPSSFWRTVTVQPASRRTGRAGVRSSAPRPPRGLVIRQARIDCSGIAVSCGAGRDRPPLVRRDQGGPALCRVIIGPDADEQPEAAVEQAAQNIAR